MRRAIFLDRDGTIIAEKKYLRDPKQAEVLANAGRALRRLQDAGFLLIVVTNQSGIGRGYFTVEEMERVHAHLALQLQKEGVRLEKFYFAPETPDAPSHGRKPSPQFLFDARDEFGLDLSQSYMIGDKLIDLECGSNAGVKHSLLVRTGYGSEWEQKMGSNVGPATVVDDLAAAAEWILTQKTATSPGKIGRVLGIIPARYGSSRFPGKPLARVLGKPLIQWVIERCRLAQTLDGVVVATDDRRIAEIAEPFCQVEMTQVGHPSGSDRIAEVVARCTCDAAINIQGDEPLIKPETINAVVGALAENEMSTAASLIRDPSEYENPNVVKVVVSRLGQALYFSRRTIPYVRDEINSPVELQLPAFPFLKHVGIYGYRREALLRLVRLPISSLEAAEKLEQLRALENGMSIGVVQVDDDSIGVDVAEDIGRIEALLNP